MNVLFLTRRAAPDIGGVERHIMEVARGLEKKKIRIKIITERDIDPPRIKYLGLFYIWWWLFQNRTIIEKADIVHCHDVYIWYWPFRFLYPAKFSYVTFHGWEGVFPVPFKNILIRKISAYLAKGNICVGHFISELYGIKTNFITYGGVNQFKFKFKFPTSSRLRGAGKKKTKILYVGRLEKDTGFVEIMKAFFELKLKYPKIEIEFLGDGPLRSDAESVGKVLGFQKDVFPFIANSRFVIASGYLSILEAMIMKKLVFSMAHDPARHKYLHRSPFIHYIIAPTNSQMLVKKIELMMNAHDTERKIVEKAYNFAKAQTWEKVASTYLSLWEPK